jgi:hypothetical protein
MKVAVIANCQGESLVKCLSAMTDRLKVSCYMVHEIVADADQLERVLLESDYVFTQTSLTPHLPDGHQGRVVYFPAIAFSAYHPDLTFVRGRKAGGALETVSNPLSGYHSTIALFGYVYGISLDDILTFYHAGVYSRLGYFDQWDEARRQLLAEGEQCGMPVNSMFEKWADGDAFMYSSNHPTLRVVEDIARELLRRIGVKPLIDDVQEIVTDPLRAMPIWPKYPEIAERLGLQGNMVFKPHEPERALTLTEFVTSSYECFGPYDRHSLEAVSVPLVTVAQRLGFAEVESRPVSRKNPYSDSQKFQFWKNSVAAVEIDELDPVVGPRFAISPTDKVATAGSCFAQHIARTLKTSGFNYFVPESAPSDMDEATARDLNYGVFSARFGNIYTVRQLRQLIERVEGRFQPRASTWESPIEDRLVDPFRPQIVPQGFADEAALLSSRLEHFGAVRTMLREMDVFVFTLGLTEGWRARFDGAVFPLAPGVAGGCADPEEYEFVNFDVDEIRADMHEVISQIKTINPTCRIILTVSPVPLIATFEPRHALVATTYSKSVLRVVADEMWRKYDHVDYFPSYEIITGNFNRGGYFGSDLREVTVSGVAHVMNMFMRHYAGAEESKKKNLVLSSVEVPRSAFFDIVCDEEAIANF